MTKRNSILVKIPAIILCILLVLTMVCNYAHVTSENLHGTQLFAVPFCLTTDAKTQSSQIGKNVYGIISWINPFTTVFEDKPVCINNSYSISDYVYNSYPYTQYEYGTNCFINKPLVCFLRI